MAYYPATPFVPQFTNDAGVPLSGGTITAYVAGTTTPTNMFVDDAGTSAGSVITLNARGEPQVSGNTVVIWLDDAVNYKFVLKDASGQSKWTIDNIGTARGDFTSGDEGKGAALVGYYDPVAPTYLKTVSDIINGEEVSLFRFIPPSKHAGIYAQTNSDDLTTNIQDGLTAVSTSKRGRLFVPAGYYNTRALTMSGNCKSIRGVGAASRFIALGAYTANTALLYADTITDLNIRDLALYVDKATYPTIQALKLNAITKGLVQSLRIPKAGNFGIYSVAGADIVFDDIAIDDYVTCAFYADTAPQRLTLSKVRGFFSGASHTMQISGGSGHLIENCYSAGAGAFGINMFGVAQSKIANNYCIADHYEGINITDCSQTDVINNIIACTPAQADFGLSLHASTADMAQNTVKGNRIYSSGKAGIALASTAAYAVRLTDVQGNFIISPNTLNEAFWGGITCYGSTLCKENTIKNNTCWDEGGKMRYGVGELNDGGGIPDANIFIDNYSVGSAITADTLLLGANSLAYDMKPQSYTQTITSLTGTLTTAASTLKYKRRGKFVDVDIAATITTNGTGGTAINVTMPFNVVNGVLNGRENGVSGKQINASPAGTNLLIRNYDNTYPGASGANMQLSGILEIA